jgi:flavodoxin
MSSFRRKGPTKTPRKRFLIVCEGEKSEPNYIGGVKKTLRTDLIEITVIPRSGATKEVVQRAADEKKAALRASKKSGDPFDKFDEVWCVFDVDSHSKLPDAIKQAIDNGIEIALSNPSYELWVVLHHRDERKFIERGSLASECKRVYRQTDKHVPFEILWPNYETAKQNAIGLRKWQSENDKSQHNPWTDFDELIEALLGRDVRKKKPK